MAVRDGFNVRYIIISLREVKYGANANNNICEISFMVNITLYPLNIIHRNTLQFKRSTILS